MDADADERLKRLQMEDLGTARREHISTADENDRRLQRLRLEDIEATRQSNKVGSDAHRLAQKNSTKLNAWASVHEKIGDTSDLEELDELLNGQSHRLNLAATLHLVGSDPSDGGSTQALRFQEQAKRGRGGRPAGYGGRGGGIVGTRSRGSASPPKSNASRTTNQGSITKLQGRTAMAALRGRTHLDPALQPEQDSYKQSRAEHEFQKNDAKSSTPSPAASVKSLPMHKSGPPPAQTKPRRPIPQASQQLSNPSDFLAAARRLVSFKLPSSNPTAAVRASTSVKVTSQSQKAQAQAAEKQDEQRVLQHEHGSRADSVTDLESVAMSTGSSVPSLQPVMNRSRILGTVAKEASNVSANEREQITQQQPSLDAVLQTESDGGRSKQSKDLSPSLPQASQPPNDNQSKTQREKKNDIKVVCEEILLDVSVLSPEPPGIARKPGSLLRTPGMEDLEGLVIQQEFVGGAPSDGKRPEAVHFSPKRKLDFKGPDKPPTANVSNDLSSNDVVKSAGFRFYVEELARLRKLMSTVSVEDDGYLNHLRMGERHLEFLIQNLKQRQDGGGATLKQEQHETARNVDGGVGKKLYSKDLRVLSPSKDDTSEHAALVKSSAPTTAAEDALPLLPVQPVNTPSSASRFRVDAAPFVPRTPSFSGWRSPPRSAASSVSEISQELLSPTPTPAPVPARRYRLDFGAITEASGSVTASAPYHQPQERKPEVRGVDKMPTQSTAAPLRHLDKPKVDLQVPDKAPTQTSSAPVTHPENPKIESHVAVRPLTVTGSPNRPAPQEPAAQPTSASRSQSGHIFGDHLLPGGSKRGSPETNVSSVVDTIVVPPRRSRASAAIPIVNPATKSQVSAAPTQPDIVSSSTTPVQSPSVLSGVNPVAFSGFDQPSAPAAANVVQPPPQKQQAVNTAQQQFQHFGSAISRKLTTTTTISTNLEQSTCTTRAEATTVASPPPPPPHLENKAQQQLQRFSSAISRKLTSTATTATTSTNPERSIYATRAEIDTRAQSISTTSNAPQPLTKIKPHSGAPVFQPRSSTNVQRGSSSAALGLSIHAPKSQGNAPTITSPAPAPVLAPASFTTSSAGGMGVASSSAPSPKARAQPTQRSTTSLLNSMWATSENNRPLR